MARGEAFTPDYNVISNITQHTTHTELFVAENVAVPRIPDPPKNCQEHEGPEESFEARWRLCRPGFFIGHGGEVLHLDDLPQCRTCVTVEENVISIFISQATSFTGWPIDYMLVVEVDFSTQTILEVQPCEDFDFVGQPGAPNELAIHITIVSRGV